MSILTRFGAITAFSLLVSCGGQRSPGYMISTTADPSTGRMVETYYSPYYEFEYQTSDKKISCRLISTLGPERIPAGYKHTGPFASDLPRAYRDGLVEWATEIYFFNRTDTEITIKPISISACGARKNFNADLLIPANSFKITPPLVEISGGYGSKCEVAFEFEYQGERITARGTSKRLTVQEMKAKYGARNS